MDRKQLAETDCLCVSYQEIRVSKSKIKSGDDSDTNTCIMLMFNSRTNSMDE